MTLYSLGTLHPEIRGEAWIADSATVLGSVVLENNASVWFGAVLRGDNDLIHIGENTNIQDGAILHTDPGIEVILGKNVIVGHQAMLHGCKIGDGSLIGMQAIILNNVVIGKNCLIAAGALIPEGRVIPDHSLVVGTPGKIIREVTEQDIIKLRENSSQYVEKWKHYRSALKPIPYEAATQKTSGAPKK